MSSRKNFKNPPSKKILFEITNLAQRYLLSVFLRISRSFSQNRCYHKKVPLLSTAQFLQPTEPLRTRLQIQHVSLFSSSPQLSPSLLTGVPTAVHQGSVSFLSHQSHILDHTSQSTEVMKTRRIGTGKKRLTKIWKDHSIKAATKKKPVESLIFSIKSYGSESWKLNKALCRRLKIFQMICSRHECSEYRDELHNQS